MDFIVVLTHVYSASNHILFILSSVFLFSQIWWKQYTIQIMVCTQMLSPRKIIVQLSNQSNSLICCNCRSGIFTCIGNKTV